MQVSIVFVGHFKLENMRADKCPVEVSMIKDEKTEENARSQSTMNWEEEHINQSEKQMQQEKQEARE